MRTTSLLLRKTSENLEVLKKILDKALAEAPQYLSKVKIEQKKIVYDKIQHLNKWYTKFIGLDEVKIYQERVTALQEQLLSTQTKRRELNTQLSKLRHEAQEVQNQIQHIDRKEKFDVYCQLINDEREVLNMERSVFATFQEYDQAERDLFTAFTNAVRDSQEKQRAQLEYSKYIGLTVSLIGSFLAFIYTFFWKQDLKLYIKDQINSVKPYVDIDKSQLQNTLKFLGTEIQQLKTKQNNGNVVIKSELQNALKILQKEVHQEMLNNTNNQQKFGNQQTEIEEQIFKVVKYIGIGIVGLVVLKLLSG